MKKKLLALALILAVAFFFAACPQNGDDDEGDVPKALVGTFAFWDNHGSIILYIGESKSLSAMEFGTKKIYTVSGEIKIDALTFSVTGDYDSSNGSLNVDAEMTVGVETWKFIFNGTYSNDVFQGTLELYIDDVLTGQGAVNGSGTEDPDSVWVYLGTIGDGAASSGNGTFNATVEGDNMYGTWYHHDGTGGEPHTGPYEGTRSGTSIPPITIYEAGEPIGSGSGDFSADYSTVSGVWGVAPDSGHWEGTRQ